MSRAGSDRDRPRPAATRGRHRAPPTVTRGIALVLVLWVIALLTVMALGLTATQRTETALTRNQVDAVRFRALADAAVNAALYELLSPPPLELEEAPPQGGEAATPGWALGWLPDGQPHLWRFAGETLEVRIENEASRLDLNVTEREHLESLLLALPVEPELAAALADRILDWRDGDALALLDGAEDDDYAAAGYPYGAKDGPFESVEELRLVMGMSDALYEAIAPVLTVDGDRRGVDETFAAPLVLAALRGQTLEMLLADRGQSEEDPSMGRGPRAGVDRGGPLYRIRVTWVIDGRRTRTMDTLVNTSPSGPSPYEVRWRRLGLSQD
ncbi:general secretion pathway protein GspK [Thiococcus pfennigii]|uniref:general secretion pathway protein GspK n=1 Tax=Thiococcus pfennigii TaxID=1057 RepID=UPI001908BF62|nr:type II secretion system protein GspK [Thiococcus pfennigii]MBK1701692.1 hypothetical protein [Thiococcus pfennigii]MBK1731811.1 hypothetical protein [Thiococcus pfennigii]